MRAAARLRIEPLYFHDPHLPLGNGRLGLQRPEQIVAPAEFRLGQVIRRYGMVPFEDGIDFPS